MTQKEFRTQSPYPQWEQPIFPFTPNAGFPGYEFTYYRDIYGGYQPIMHNPFAYNLYSYPHPLPYPNTNSTSEVASPSNSELTYDYSTTELQRLSETVLPHTTDEPVSVPLSKQNAILIKKFYDAFIRGDIDSATKFITDDFIMHVPGKGLNAGEYWGVDGFKKFFSNIMSYGGGKFSMEVPVLAVSGNTAFTREIVKLNRKFDPERMFELHFMMQYRMRNGKISEAWTIPEDLYLYDQFWTPPTNKNTPTSSSRNKQTASQGPSTKGAVSPKNYQLIRDFYNKFWSGDLEGMKALTSDDFEFFVPGRSSLAGTYKGWEGYLKFRSELIKLAGDKYKLEIDSMSASDSDVFVREYIRMNRKWDPTLQTVPAVILHFKIRNGKIAKINDIPVDLYAYEKFFTPPVKA